MISSHACKAVHGCCGSVVIVRSVVIIIAVVALVVDRCSRRIVVVGGIIIIIAKACSRSIVVVQSIIIYISVLLMVRPCGNDHNAFGNHFRRNLFKLRNILNSTLEDGFAQDSKYYT
ncbi:hypothetical protein TorRG33x02_324930, partial [Trema orientale]